MSRARSSATRVLMLLENNPYPQDTRVRQEAIALTEAGLRVSVICPRAPGQSARETLNGVKVYRYPAPRPGDSLFGYLWEYGYSLLAMLFLTLLVSRHQGFDIVHAANPPDLSFVIAGFAKLFGKRFVFDHHDPAPELYLARFEGRGNPLVYRLLLWAERISLRLADHVITSNSSLKGLEVRRGGVAEERITVVLNGPDLRRMHPSKRNGALRQEGKTTIVYVGSIGFQDGVDSLLRALAHLAFNLRRFDFCCWIVGTGDVLASLQSLVKELRLADHVQFVGWVEHSAVMEYVGAADICVLSDPASPFKNLTLSISLMEYMALGKPTVIFDLPEFRAAAQGAALYARPNDLIDFARQIAALMDDPERRARMGQLGRERVEQELAWEYQVQHLLAAYRTLDAHMVIPSRFVPSQGDNLV